MSKHDEKDPDSVTRSDESSVPFDPGLFPRIYHTEIEKGGDTYTGSGWTQEEADKDAGDRYSEGKKDK